MDFVQGLDPSKLLLGGAVNSSIAWVSFTNDFQVLSFVVSAFSAPIYNFPLFLYGLYGQENTESVSALQNVRYSTFGMSFFAHTTPMTSSQAFWLARCSGISYGWLTMDNMGSSSS